MGGVEVIGLTWGVFSPFLINKSPPYDIILASDCFYDSKGNIHVYGISLIKYTSL